MRGSSWVGLVLATLTTLALGTTQVLEARRESRFQEQLRAEQDAQLERLRQSMEEINELCRSGRREFCPRSCGPSPMSSQSLPSATWPFDLL